MRISYWSSDVCSSDLNIHSNLCSRALRCIRRALAAQLPPDMLAEPVLHHGSVSRLLRRQRWHGGSMFPLGRGRSQIADYHRLRSEEHTSELQSLMRISYAVFCLKKKNRMKT